MTSNVLNLWTDGSSKDNGKPHCTAGWSMVTRLGGLDVVRYGNLPAPSSNNRGEMSGVLYALKILNNLNRPIHIFSDSEYTVKTLTDWKGKRLKPGGMSGLKNADLIIPMYELWGTRAAPTQISWVRGHNGDPGNELADVWCSKGRLGEDHTRKTDTQDIKYVPFELMQKTIFGEKFYE